MKKVILLLAVISLTLISCSTSDNFESDLPTEDINSPLWVG